MPMEEISKYRAPVIATEFLQISILFPQILFFLLYFNFDIVCALYFSILTIFISSRSSKCLIRVHLIIRSVSFVPKNHSKMEVLENWS